MAWPIFYGIVLSPRGIHPEIAVVLAIRLDDEIRSGEKQ
jgi:hypothetical protein